MNIKLHLLLAGILLETLGTGLGQPPTITNQPQSCTHLVGATATFAVGATGTEPLAYQWQKTDYFGGITNLEGCMNCTMVLTNVQTADAAGYLVVITNIEGAVTSQLAQLTVVATPPRIVPTISLQHQAVDVSSNATFIVTASGLALSYQWRLDGRELSGQTQRTLTITNAQPADEGDYTAVVMNLAGAVSSDPARLWVVPSASTYIKDNFTNSLGRLPYFYFLPTNYSPARTYPLWVTFHGSPGDETMITTSNYGYIPYLNYPGLKTLASFRQQARDPVIVLWPTRRAGDSSWTDAYLRQASGLLDQFVAQFSVDTNRVTVIGGSEGVHAAWDMIRMRPGFFSAAGLAAGWQGNAPASAVKDVPVWAWCAADDDANQLGNTVAFVNSLRRAGGKLPYTQYSVGGHMGGIIMGASTPALVDWLLAQRRGVTPTNEPIVSVTSPTTHAVLPTGATHLDVSGTAAALGQAVAKVAWQNIANNATGTASGSNNWSITGIPLVANRTNLIVVTATTTSWAPAYGGSTAFNGTLTVIQAPILATLAFQATNALLNWTGGGPPYLVQRATDLKTGNWTDFLPNATAPVTLPLDGQAGFYRILGQ